MSILPAQTKHLLRQQCRQQRDALGAEIRLQASREICNHIENREIFRQVDTIQAYLPMRSEVNLAPLLEKYPRKHWVIPRILLEGRMVFHTYDPDQLIRHSFGMLEPEPHLPTVAPETIDLALVPGLAFDRNGWRLGYGGGYFDRFLNDFRGVSVGITFKALLLDSLPHEAYDIPVAYVVTEEGFLQCAREGQP